MKRYDVEQHNLYEDEFGEFVTYKDHLSELTEKLTEQRRNLCAESDTLLLKIKTIQNSAKDEIERLEQAIDAERARCLKAVDDEPELPEFMPFDVREHICRHIIGLTKQNIRKRIEEGL
jgi:hypothetical protein